ncbi:hypothetical protein ACFQ6Q_00435 [Streptomyces sp. NPDC056437]|uniref:hypothetical protein n=1 Tax=Streptomyces sp. NPDC056437 TaxID=3345816 RepID=UPI0036CB8302
MTTPGMGWKPRKVTIASDGPTATVHLDDVDLTEAIRGYTVEHRAGEHPMVVFYAKPGCEAQFDGMAMVAVGQPADPTEAVAEFLAGIDPAALQSAALNRDDLDGSKNELTTAMLKTLIDYARGGR